MLKNEKNVTRIKKRKKTFITSMGFTVLYKCVLADCLADVCCLQQVGINT